MSLTGLLTSGPAAAFVNITDRTISNAAVPSPVHSGVRVGSGGELFAIQANGGFSEISGEWLPVGTPGDFFVASTIISGTLEVDAGSTFVVCSTNRDYDNQKTSQGLKITNILLTFSSDVSGVPVVGTATLIFESENL